MPKPVQLEALRLSVVWLAPILLLPSIVTAQNPTVAPGSKHPASTAPTSTDLTVRILNAQTNRPVTNERLNVAFTERQVDYLLLPTDKHGVVHLSPGDNTTVRILPNFYADCRPRLEIYTNYSLGTLRREGISTGNLCSSAHPASRPGELLLFVIPKNLIRTMGQPPASGIPHSDENPHTTTDNPLIPPPISDPNPPHP